MQGPEQTATLQQGIPWASSAQGPESSLPSVSGGSTLTLSAACLGFCPEPGDLSPDSDTAPLAVQTLTECLCGQWL